MYRAPKLPERRNSYVTYRNEWKLYMCNGIRVSDNYASEYVYVYTRRLLHGICIVAAYQHEPRPTTLEYKFNVQIIES